MVFYSIDLHTDSFVMARLTYEGPEAGKIKIAKYYLDETSFQSFKNTLTKDDYVLVEACTNAFWFYDQIIDLAQECFVLDVNKYKASINKTDKIDVKKLVKKLAFYITTKGDQDDLPVVYVPPVQVRELRALFTTYGLNKKAMTQFKNRIHSLLKQNGICVAKKEIPGPNFSKKIANWSLGPTWKFQITTLIEQLEMLEKQTAAIKKVIIQLGYQLFPKEIEILMSIKGFSPLTAIALMSDVIDVNRFSSAKKFCAYLRTAPRVKSSNNTTKIGSTNKNSRSLSCTLLCQSVEHFAKSGKYLSDFYSRMKVGKRPGVYRMAMIRKILVSAYYMLKREKLFYWTDEKLYNKKLKEIRNVVNTNLKAS